MARLCGRVMLSAVRRQISYPAARFYSKEFNDPIEHATGLEKRELLAKLAGNNDPFHMDAIKRSATSSKEKPTLIPSAFEARIIGCVCHEDQTHVNWMWLHQGIPKRCECGHWFKLYEVAPL